MALTKEAEEFEERLLQVAGHAVGKVLDVYKRKMRKGAELKKLKLLEEIAQCLELLIGRIAG